MGKDKLRRFAENEILERMFQPRFEEVFNADYKLKGLWNTEVFKNTNPIVLELGCGHGEYTVELSQKYPNKNYIGVDIKGARMWKGAKAINMENVLNAAFLRTRIELITSCFGHGEISEIWITFPDPQRKLHRTMKRLTSSPFLTRYRTFLKPDGIIHLKTDSRFLYEYTKALLTENNLKINLAGTDIYSRDIPNPELSIKTHYEKQYLSQGIPITYLQFKIGGNETIKEPEQFDLELF
ncbi:MAG: tRNA (guanosine(46)-N7)-methyltransferase TrmB [Prevotellaceae bacterium]|nr:tRNA (guanosine(46)-N7)-methyltransferase TrmB [Prevotellaceae bacterium]